MTEVTKAWLWILNREVVLGHSATEQVQTPGIS